MKRAIAIAAAYMVVAILDITILMPTLGGESDGCRLVSHGMVQSGARQRVVGTSNSEKGEVPLVLEGVPFMVTVRNGLFSAWVDVVDGKPVAVTDARG